MNPSAETHSTLREIDRHRRPALTLDEKEEVRRVEHRLRWWMQRRVIPDARGAVLIHRGRLVSQIATTALLQVAELEPSQPGRTPARSQRLRGEATPSEGVSAKPDCPS